MTEKGPEKNREIRPPLQPFRRAGEYWAKSGDFSSACIRYDEKNLTLVANCPDYDGRTGSSRPLVQLSDPNDSKRARPNSGSVCLRQTSLSTHNSRGFGMTGEPPSIAFDGVLFPQVQFSGHESSLPKRVNLACCIGPAQYRFRGMSREILATSGRKPRLIN